MEIINNLVFSIQITMELTKMQNIKNKSLNNKTLRSLQNFGFFLSTPFYIDRKLKPKLAKSPRCHNLHQRDFFEQGFHVSQTSSPKIQKNRSTTALISLAQQISARAMQKRMILDWEENNTKQFKQKMKILLRQYYEIRKKEHVTLHQKVKREHALQIAKISNSFNNLVKKNKKLYRSILNYCFPSISNNATFRQFNNFTNNQIQSLHESNLIERFADKLIENNQNQQNINAADGIIIEKKIDQLFTNQKLKKFPTLKAISKTEKHQKKISNLQKLEVFDNTDNHNEQNQQKQCDIESLEFKKQIVIQNNYLFACAPKIPMVGLKRNGQLMERKQKTENSQKKENINNLQQNFEKTIGKGPFVVGLKGFISQQCKEGGSNKKRKHKNEICQKSLKNIVNINQHLDNSIHENENKDLSYWQQPSAQIKQKKKLKAEKVKIKTKIEHENKKSKNIYTNVLKEPKSLQKNKVKAMKNSSNYSKIIGKVVKVPEVQKQVIKTLKLKKYNRFVNRHILLKRNKKKLNIDESWKDDIDCEKLLGQKSQNIDQLQEGKRSNLSSFSQISVNDNKIKSNKGRLTKYEEARMMYNTRNMKKREVTLITSNKEQKNIIKIKKPGNAGISLQWIPKMRNQNATKQSEINIQQNWQDDQQYQNESDLPSQISQSLKTSHYTSRFSRPISQDSSSQSEQISLQNLSSLSQFDLLQVKHNIKRYLKKKMGCGEKVKELYKFFIFMEQCLENVRYKQKLITQLDPSKMQQQEDQLKQTISSITIKVNDYQQCKCMYLNENYNQKSMQIENKRFSGKLDVRTIQLMQWESQQKEKKMDIDNLKQCSFKEIVSIPIAIKK